MWGRAEALLWDLASISLTTATILSGKWPKIEAIMPECERQLASQCAERAAPNYHPRISSPILDGANAPKTNAFRSSSSKLPTGYY
jgi:hypothetical protein